MLGSITPLGERGRGSRWGVTVTAYLFGSVAGGAAFGAALGWIGSPLDLSPNARLALLGVAIVIGIAFDLGVGGLRLPSTHRQVDEAWRASYRGWVWGLTFGAQLALGVITVVTTALVYVTWLGAGLAGSLGAGALVGSAFGLAALASLMRLVVDATKILPAVRGGSTLNASATPPSSLTGSALLASALAVSGTSLGDSILSVELPAAVPARASRLLCSAICSLTHTQVPKSD